MRILIWVIVLCLITSAQKRFFAEYFVQKYNLKLPEITQEMLNVANLSHTSDLWEYFYKGNTHKLDSIIENLTIQGFPPSRKIMIYIYKGNTTKERLISIGLDNGDTLNNYVRTFTDDFRTKESLDLETNCIWKSRFDERGIKLLDVRKCPGEKEFSGQVFSLEKHENYLESIPIKEGVVDSNNIRRYYLAPFDSIVADFLVERNKTPVFFNLIIYNKQQQPVYKYSFDVFRQSNPVVNYNYHTYDNAGRLKRIYLFYIKNWNSPEDGFVLTNVTEYEYDKIGRKVKKTTKVMPDKKEKKTE